MRSICLRLWSLAGLTLLCMCAAEAAAPPLYDPRSICRQADKPDCLAEQRGYHRLVEQIWPTIDTATQRHCIIMTRWGDYVRMFRCLAYGEVDLSDPKE